ncbi:beta-ketoacyl-ACP synthase III [Gloeocapsa sp. PCC 73106]|uniref:beta-ketoacyl-ACP synthase III n=1 Tax=Gloeocapsa sp. PCC 73106 TaxID=102232 RepID=UPI0002AC86D1|nr:beta-ketoacyl-ACP synthase III [Gloeocapsa sp. PCC 73106]ELR97386.1 3-oxoacyl-(acyl-carrier-protein) synthase III [Gloeocapsa sp. PCC 73106]
MFSAYINAIGKFLPGEAIANPEMEAYLGKVNGKASRVKQRILNSNGIQQRYYALNQQQQTTWSNSQMAANAVRDVLSKAEFNPREIDLLACATTIPDLLVPGFASMVHGELPELSPLETVSTQGVCCAGVSALNYAASQLQLGHRHQAIAVAAEFSSRLFKHTHFETETKIKSGNPLDFDTEFLRWMLSDGAGACLIQNHPNRRGISLKIEWIELISHANAYPVCMYAGTNDANAQKSWLDYPSYLAAAEAGVMDLRQNIRLLDNVIKLGVEGWLRLIELGKVQPEQIDWLLCHYSSHFFRGKIVELLNKANCLIPESKWFTNLYTRGNTGCASIYLMLEELFNSGKLQANQQIFCFVPESGRFTTAYMLLTVVESSPKIQEIKVEKPRQSDQGPLWRQLTQVWLEFERKLRSVPLIQRLNREEFTLEDYKALLRNLRPQVVEGARWIARAASNMTDFQLRSTLIIHAQAEHRDFQMLERNYTSVGGDLTDIVNAEKNIGGEALSGYIFHQASQPNPVQLLGSIFIIEGLGHQLAGKWATQIQRILKLQDEQVSFLAYHGDNDESHLSKIETLLQADWLTPDIAEKIVKTARVTARLYLLQLEEIS